MIYKLVVPGPIEGVDEVRVLQWFASEGDDIEPGQILVELETEKTIVEVQCSQRGRLRRIIHGDGEWAKLGIPLALFSEVGDETLPEDPASAQPLASVFQVD